MSFYQPQRQTWIQAIGTYVPSHVPRGNSCWCYTFSLIVWSLVLGFIAIGATTVPTITLRTPETTYNLFPLWIKYEFEINNITARVGSDNSTASFNGGNTAVNASSGVKTPVLRRRADDGAETAAASSTVAASSSTTGTGTSVATTSSSGTATSTDSTSSSQSTSTEGATEGDASLVDTGDDQGDDISGDNGRVRQFGFIFLKRKLPQKLPLKDSVSDKAELFKLISDKSKDQRFGNGFATGLMYLAAVIGPIVWAVLMKRKDPAQALQPKYYVIFALVAILCYIPVFVVTTVVLVNRFLTIGKSPSFPTSGTKAGLVAEYGKWWIALNVLSLVMLLLLPVAARLGEKLDLKSTYKASQARVQNQGPEMATVAAPQLVQQHQPQFSYSNENLTTMPQVVPQPLTVQYV